MKHLLAALACMGGIALAQNTVDSTFCWSGSVDENGRVITGSPDSTSGWWYEFSDENDGGSSYIQFPTDIETFDDGLFFGHLVESYGALKGEARLQDGYEYPYVGLAFNVWNIDKKGADITAWGGICLAYISTIAFSIELVPEDEKMTEDDNYKAFVSKAPSGSSYNFPWDKFKQGGWGKAADRDSVLKQVSSVRLIFQGTAGTSGDFSIGAMGSLDICALYSRCATTHALKQTASAPSLKASLSGRMLEFTGATALATASVIDLQGNTVKSAAALGAMDLSTLPSGIYMLRIDGPAVHHSQKIVLK